MDKFTRWLKLMATVLSCLPPPFDILEAEYSVFIVAPILHETLIHYPKPHEVLKSYAASTWFHLILEQCDKWCLCLFLVFLFQVKLWKIHIFTLIQVICLALLWVVKNSIIAIAFPFFLILLVVFRHSFRFFIFNEMDLEAVRYVGFTFYLIFVELPNSHPRSSSS